MNGSKHIDVFVKEMSRRNYSINSIDTYKGNMNIFFKYFKEKEHPLHVNADDIKKLLSEFDEPGTQRSIHSAVKLFYSICFNQDAVNRLRTKQAQYKMEFTS